MRCIAWCHLFTLNGAAGSAPSISATIRRSVISLVAAATTARFPRPAFSALISSPSLAFQSTTTSSTFSPSRQSRLCYTHSTIMGGRRTRSSAQRGEDHAGTAVAVPIAAISQRRKSPRLNPSVVSLSTSSGSASGSASDDNANVSSSSSSTSKSSVRKTRGRPRRKAAEITSDDTETSSADGRKKRRSTRVKKADATATATSTDTKKSKKVVKKEEKEEAKPVCLPRAREQSLQKSFDNNNLMVIGVDEAGRGPLAGPVCAAAALLPIDIAGITDSKKITKEEERERLYEEIVAAPGVRWAAAIVDAQRIDEINILQATMEAMKMATNAVMHPPTPKECIKEASVDRMGCYVICGANDEKGRAIEPVNAADAAVSVEGDIADSYYALIDGNRLPKEMPCEAEPMVKGDSREYCIGAASLIAKVTRDRLMHAYDKLHPEYNLKQHKGYPTAAHMSAVFKHGASPIHRRTFAPLKHMSFDKDGRVVEDKEEE